jgi:hypothetical protein
MKTYEIDIVTEDRSLDEAIIEMNSIEGVTVVMTVPEGLGSGWPTVIASVTDEALPALEAWYGSEII